jgi:hypothetical protein
MLDHAEYAIVESVSGGPVTVSLRRVPLDRSAVHRRVDAAERPVKAVLLDGYSA